MSDPEGKNAPAIQKQLADIARTGSVPIPSDLDEDGRALFDLMSVLRRGSEWWTAATVYAWTYDAERGRPPKNGENSPFLTLSEFADLGLRGLSHRHTVRKYRRAWKRATRKGWAEEVKPGDSVTLPSREFEAANPDRPALPDREYETAVEMGGTKSTTGVEWYTPPEYINAARDVMGGIDLDPATSVKANETVQADAIFTEEDDGLEHNWNGRVWLNPPYGKGSGQFTTKLVAEYEAGRVDEAVLLLNAYGFDSEWFQPLWQFPICFTDHRIEFTSPDKDSGGPANGNIFVYLGGDVEAFIDQFEQYGTIVQAVTDA